LLVSLKFNEAKDVGGGYMSWCKLSHKDSWHVGKISFT